MRKTGFHFSGSCPRLAPVPVSRAFRDLPLAGRGALISSPARGSARTLAESAALGNRRMQGGTNARVTAAAALTRNPPPPISRQQSGRSLPCLPRLLCRLAEARIAPHFPLLGGYAGRGTRDLSKGACARRRVQGMYPRGCVRRNMAAERTRGKVFTERNGKWRPPVRRSDRVSAWRSRSAEG